MRRYKVTYANFGNSVALAVCLASSAFGQYVISAQSGLIHHTQGQVLLDGAEVRQKLGEYPSVKAGQRLTTEDGLAEILLTPGVFLRLAENSEIRMVANALTDTRIEVVKGAVLVEAGEVTKEHSIAVTVKGTDIEVRKRGVFRIDAGGDQEQARIRVYDGEVTVAQPGTPVTVKEGRQLVLTSVPTVEKFAKQDTDAFYRWAGRRSGYLAMANISAARRMGEIGMPWQAGGWYFNPYFGMFTYIPLNGRYINAWNHAYYSPGSAYRQLQPVYNGPLNGGGGGGMMGGSSGYSGGGRGYSGGSVSAGGGSAPAAPAAAPSAGASSARQGGAR